MLALYLAVTLAQPKLAAPAWSAVDVPADKATFFSTHLATALRNEGVSLITADDIAVVLGNERQKQLLGCADEDSSCMIELGAALGAEHLLSGAIAKLEEKYVVTLRVIKSLDGKVVAQEQARAASQEALLDALTVAARSLADQLAPPGHPRRGLRPFVIPLIVAGVTAAAGATFFVLALNTSAELDSRLVPGANRDELNVIGSRGQAFEALGWVGLGLGVAGAVTALVMKLTESSTVVSVGAARDGAMVQLGGRW